MSRHSLAFAFALLCSCFCVTNLSAQFVNITDGTSSYFWDPDAPQTTNLIDQTAGDISFEDMWIIRFTDSSGLGGDEKIYQLDETQDNFGVFYQGSVNSGDSAVSTWNIFGQGGGPTLFTVTLTHTISTNADGVAVLTHAMELSNFTATPNIAPNSDLDIFYFNDFDMLPDFGDNSAGHTFKGPLRDIGMSSSGGFTASTRADATNYQMRAVGAGTRLSTAVLNGSIVDLSNSGGPLLNVDINGMFQWDTTVPGAGSGLSRFANVTTKAIPEPSSMALLAIIGVAGLCVTRRRK